LVPKAYRHAQPQTRKPPQASKQATGPTATHRQVAAFQPEAEPTLAAPTDAAPPTPPDMIIEMDPTGPPMGQPDYSYPAYVRGSRFWARGEYLMWWLDGYAIPPLVTTSPVGTDRTVAGVIGEPTTSILLDGDLEENIRIGGRINLGYWFNPMQTFGIQGGYLGVGQRGTLRLYESDTYPILARPFENVEPGFEGEDAEIIAFPELFEGNIDVWSDSSLHGAEVLGRLGVYRSPRFRLDLLGGWRLNQLDEVLTIRDFKESIGVGSGLAVGTTVEEIDRFETQNWFNGGGIGLIAVVQRASWEAEFTFKVGLGNTHSEATISGRTTTTVPVPGEAPDVDVRQTGLLAQETNIGFYENDTFAAVPEFGITIACQMTPRLRVTFGYGLLYWSRVARPGDQIDRRLNLSQLDDTGLVGPALPEFNWVYSDLFAQGLNFGLDGRF
jgi:hypothetical protein